MQYDAAKIGQRLRALREAGGWSLRALEERASEAGRHLSHTTISQVELGRRKRRSIDVLETLAFVLGWPDYETMLTSEALDPPAAGAPAAGDAGDTRVIDNHRTGASNGGAPVLSTGDGVGREARGPSPEGGLRPLWHRVYRQGSPDDPSRPGDGTGGGTYEVRPLAPEEHDSVGREGFGVTVTNDSVANWEGRDGHVVRVGAIAWCDPAKRAEVREGDLVVAHDPVQGLTLGIYREGEGGIVLETDEPGVPIERRPCDASWIIGPVVYVTTLGGRPRRRARGQPPGHTDPASHTFVADHSRTAG